MKRSLQMLIYFLAALMYTSGLGACPDVSGKGYQLSYSSEELYTPRSFQVVAGGSQNLSNCAQPGVGFVAAAPDFELFYRHNRNYALEFRVESNCDTVLLINTGAGNWYFDDDDNDGLNAKIRLGTPSGGWYDIWVGTYGRDLCDAVLIIETF